MVDQGGCADDAVEASGSNTGKGVDRRVEPEVSTSDFRPTSQVKQSM